MTFAEWLAKIHEAGVHRLELHVGLDTTIYAPDGGKLPDDLRLMWMVQDNVAILAGRASAAAANADVPCPTCHGSGRVPNPDPSGDPRVRVYCPDCGGSGKVKESSS